MNGYVLDVVVGLTVLISLALGGWRGFLYELLSLAGWVAAFVAARFWAADAAARLPMAGASPELKLVVAFVLVFVAVAFAAGVLAWLVRKLASASALRPVDRSLGLAFGGLRAVLLLAVVGAAGVLTPLGRQPFWMESVSGPWLTWMGQRAVALLPAEMGKVLN